MWHTQRISGALNLFQITRLSMWLWTRLVVSRLFLGVVIPGVRWLRKSIVEVHVTEWQILSIYKLIRLGTLLFQLCLLLEVAVPASSPHQHLPPTDRAFLIWVFSSTLSTGASFFVSFVQLAVCGVRIRPVIPITLTGENNSHWESRKSTQNLHWERNNGVQIQ
jgi:hypothetical protein